MKKRWKVFWSICVISGIVGVILFVTALNMGVTLQKVESIMPLGITIWNFEEVKSSDASVDVSDGEFDNIFEDITSLELDLKAGEVEILTSYNDYVEIKTENISKKLKLNHYRDGKTLVVDSTDHLEGIVNQNLGTVSIYLPEELYLEDVEINVGAGSLYIENICANDFSVDIGAGEAEICSFLAKEADFDCGAGEIVAHGNADKVIDIDCGMGSISYYTSDHEDNYSYKLNCGVGEIVCGANHYSGIGSEQKIDHHHASKEMDIECGLGKVEIIFEGGH